MDFKLSYEQEAIQKAAEEFAAGEFEKEIALEHEKSHTFPYDIWKKACELGFVGIHYPEEYGGQEYGVLENALVVEAFCRQDSGLGIALSRRRFLCGDDPPFRKQRTERKVSYPHSEGRGNLQRGLYGT